MLDVTQPLSQVKPLLQLCFDALTRSHMAELGVSMDDVRMKPIPAELQDEKGISYPEYQRRSHARWHFNDSVGDARRRVDQLTRDRAEACFRSRCRHCEICTGGPAQDGRCKVMWGLGKVCHRGNHQTLMRPCPEAAIALLCAATPLFLAENLELLNTPPPPRKSYEELDLDDEDEFYQSIKGPGSSMNSLWEFKLERRAERVRRRVFAPFAFP